jgi:hypothetical protein
VDSSPEESIVSGLAELTLEAENLNGIERFCASEALR